MNEQEKAECRQASFEWHELCLIKDAEIARLKGARDALLAACELGLRHFKPNDGQRKVLQQHPELLAVYNKVCQAFEAAIAEAKRGEG